MVGRYRDQRGITAIQDPFQGGQQQCGGGAWRDVKRTQDGYA
jgi:hypothetical protein